MRVIKLKEVVGFRNSYLEAKQLLGERRGKLERMAAMLLEKEKIDENDIVATLGPRSK